MNSKKIFLCVLCCLLLTVSSASSALAKPTQVTIFTSLAGSTWYGIGAGIAKILAEYEVNANAELGASVSNIVNVVNGKGEIGMTMTAAVSLAERGVAPFRQKVTKARGLLGLSPSYLQIATPKADNTLTVPDLKGKRFVTQPKGAITAEVFSAVLRAYGMDDSSLNLSRGSLDVQIDQMKDRHAAGMVSMASFPSGFFSELAGNIPLRMLSVSDEAFEKLANEMPGLSRGVIPAGTYAGVDEDVPTVVSKLSLVVSADMPDEDAYWLAQTLMKHKDEVRALHSSYADLTDEDFATIPGVPLHPGAEKYYREVGILK